MANDYDLRTDNVSIYFGDISIIVQCYKLASETGKVEAFCDDCKVPTEMLPFMDLIGYDGDNPPRAIQIYECAGCGELVAYTYLMQAITSDEVDNTDIKV